MANELTTSTMAEIIPSEVIQASRFAYADKSWQSVPGVCRTADLTGQRGKVATFATYQAASVTKPAAETTDMTTNSDISTTALDLTVARRSVRVVLSDLAVASAAENISVAAGEAIGMARATQVDTDLFGVVTTNWTTNQGATNDTSITPNTILLGVLDLQSNKAFSGNINLVLHPKQHFHLLDDIVFSTNTYTDRSTQGQVAMDTGLIPTIAGARVIVTNAVSTGTDTNDMYLGMLYDGSVLGYAVKDIYGVESDRSVSQAADILQLNYYDAAGVIDGAGICLIKSQTY